jgi:aerobic-type carbon monoxide dehydrogenase small subunit (CoxS/CutS family)
MIPDVIKSINDGALFNHCIRLTTVTIGNGLKEILGAWVLNNCTLLEDIVVIPNAVKMIEDHTLGNCSGSTTVTLDEGLEEIGEEACYSCTLLQHMVIPNAIKTIEDHAFRSCSGLTTVTIGIGLKEIGACTIMYCRLLEEIVIP